MTAEAAGPAGIASYDRICAASETLSRVEPFLNAFGITRVARHTGLDNLGIPIWCAFTPNSKSIVVAQGKGITDDDARASAVMEALERAVAGDPNIAIVTDTMNGLMSRGRFVDPLPGLIANKHSDPDPDATIDWVAGRDILGGKEVFVPLEAVLLDRTRHDNRYWMSSDGLASGNCDDEAILHGVLERIERDAFVLWNVAPLIDRQARCVDPAVYGDATMTEFLARIEAAGLTLRLFDITSDIDVPCFTAFLAPVRILSEVTIRYVEVTNGSGAHPSASLAALRAVTEAAQSRLTYISGSRDDVFVQSFRAPLPDETRRLFTSMPRGNPCRPQPSFSSVGSTLEHVFDRLRGANIPSAIAVKLSNEGWPFSVIKVLLPALENPEGNRARRFGQRALIRTLWA